jgi:hypothetical protein
MREWPRAQIDEDGLGGGMIDLCVPRTPSLTLSSTFPEGDLDFTVRTRASVIASRGLRTRLPDARSRAELAALLARSDAAKDVEILPQRQRAVDVEEVDRDHAGGLGAQELPPAGIGSPHRRWRDPVALQDPPDRRRADPVAEQRSATISDHRRRLRGATRRDRARAKSNGVAIGNAEGSTACDWARQCRGRSALSCRLLASDASAFLSLCSRFENGLGGGCGDRVAAVLIRFKNAGRDTTTRRHLQTVGGDPLSDRRGLRTWATLDPVSAENPVTVSEQQVPDAPACLRPGHRPLSRVVDETGVLTGPTSSRRRVRRRGGCRRGSGRASGGGWRPR